MMMMLAMVMMTTMMMMMMLNATCITIIVNCAASCPSFLCTVVLTNNNDNDENNDNHDNHDNAENASQIAVMSVLTRRGLGRGPFDLERRNDSIPSLKNNKTIKMVMIGAVQLVIPELYFQLHLVLMMVLLFIITTMIMMKYSFGFLS